MLVKAKMDAMGSLILEPKNERIAKRYARHLRKFDQHADGSIYLQNNVEEMQDHFRPAQWRDINAGWTVCIRMDQWEYATMLGYDANTI